MNNKNYNYFPSPSGETEGGFPSPLKQWSGARMLLVLMMILFSLTSAAQTEQAKVILKNGTEVTGVIKSFDPATAIVIEVAGFETTIKMEDVQKVEKVGAAKTAEQTTAPANDKAALPKEKTVNIAGVDVKFILIEGGTFTFGYDGKGSVSMWNSEPVHNVTLSAFYISENYITRDVWKAVLGEDPMEDWTIHDKDGYEIPMLKNAIVATINDKVVDDTFHPINRFVNALNSTYKDLHLSIPTETQWYYVAARQHPSTKAVPMEELPDLCTEVSMHAENDPQGIDYVVRGEILPTTIEKKIRLINRSPNYSCPFRVTKGKKELRLRRALASAYSSMASDYKMAPFHLVLPAK